MSYTASVKDEGEPNHSLDIAGQALADFLQRTPNLMRLDQPGWRGAPDAFRTLGELKYLAALLPSVMRRIIDALQHEVELNLIRMEPDTTGGGRESQPKGAVQALADLLGRAVIAAQVMADCVEDAQSSIARATHAGPQSDLSSGAKD